ncbi:DoxX family protein [Zobellia sp. 1_MG-2023]|uniref:DoxX family protein n=1 Tax=Zobellia sp. 1_MG-2023 TaxID=3062626 RepID=UPI002593D0DF|nr:DoxX family protein [Zobellia sp. 1_MG-2023]MDO6817643.1 DoxX family protein [Zobellia sp. 1_MG-2023]
MKTTQLYYRVALSLFSLAIIYAVANSFFNYEAVVMKFEDLGYPSYLIFVLGTAQLLGLSVLIFNKSSWIREWAYAGFFLNLAFGIIAHLMVKDGNGVPAVFCIIALYVTFVQNKKLNDQATSATEDTHTKPTLKTVA